MSLAAAPVLSSHGCGKIAIVSLTHFLQDCLSNGTFAITTAIPVCVPKETCREPIFPQHENYTVANPDKVSYNYMESIEMKCKDPEMVAENTVRLAWP